MGSEPRVYGITVIMKWVVMETNSTVIISVLCGFIGIGLEWGKGGPGGLGAALGSCPIQDKHGHKYASATVIVVGGGTQTPRDLCVGKSDCQGWPKRRDI
jgi:hypothetical protein